jgi:hypothetical protein
MNNSKINITSIQPSQEVICREESSVQPDGKAIERLQNLKNRLSNTDLVGSYHSHVYLTQQEIESISKGASPSNADLNNLLSSNWRNVLMIVGFFANEGWNLPLQEINWKRDGSIIYCNKRVRACAYNYFHIRISGFLKIDNNIYQVPIFLGPETVQIEEQRGICSICGGDVEGGLCKHCGSRLE